MADWSFVPPTPPAKTPTPAPPVEPAKTWSWSWPQPKTPSESQPGRGRSASARRRKAKEAKAAAKAKAQEPEAPTAPFSAGANFAKATSSPFLNAYATAAVPAVPTPWISEAKSSVDDVEKGEQAALASAVRKAYPDISKAPHDIRMELEKYEKQKLKPAVPTLAGQISAATLEMEQAEEALKTLRQARDAHRKEWLGHLEQSLTAWQEHLKGYQEQQGQFAALITTAKTKFQVASSTIQHLNSNASSSAIPNAHAHATSEEEEDQSREEAIKREKLQEVLASFAKEVNQEDPIEVDDSASDGGTPRPKRPRESKDTDGPGNDGGS